MTAWRHTWWMVLLLAGSVQASEHGCTVLLCLSNPAANGGPTGVAECVPPIRRLYRDLSRGRPFPGCDLEDGNDGRSYARQVLDPYDPCPDRLQPATPETMVAEGRRVARGVVQIGPARMSQGADPNGAPVGRACVGDPLGPAQSGDPDSPFAIWLYDRVVWQQPQSPRAIDLYVDGQWQQRVHW